MPLRRLLPALAIPALLATASSAAANDSLRLIDEAFEAGRVDRETQMIYRLAAFRDPASLPATFARPSPQSVTMRCATPVAVEAYQALPRMSPQGAAQVRRLLLPPAPLAYSVETSEPYPFRVSYATEDLAGRAQKVLEAAVLAYEKLVVQYGFHAPPIEPGLEYYDMRVYDAQGAAGYTAPYKPVTETPHADAYTYIVIDPSLDDLMLATTVVHEFNHACQIAMDANEKVSFMENTASYIEGPVVPGAWPAVTQMFPYFQRHPYRPIEYKALQGTDGYEYGGAIWVMFLEQVFGNDDPRFIREVWEGTMQEGEENEPDYFDVLDDKLRDRGGLREAVKQFAEYRYFVGSDDDGKHLNDAGSWRRSEVTRLGTWPIGVLPLKNEKPPQASRPHSNGCNYGVFECVDRCPPIEFKFSGKKEADWLVRIMELGVDEPVRHDIPVQAGEGSGVIAPSEAANGLVAMMCRLSSAQYDIDINTYTPADYEFTMDYAFDVPTVTSVTPDTLAVGAKDVELIVRGTGFADYSGVAVDAGVGVALKVLEVLSPEELRVSAIVASSAEPGVRDVTVTNPGDRKGTGAGLLKVVRGGPGGSSQPGSSSDELDAEVAGGGCACALMPSSNRADASVATLALGLTALGLRASRRRRAKN